jgi:hypothetical protein
MANPAPADVAAIQLQLDEAIAARDEAIAERDEAVAAGLRKDNELAQLRLQLEAAQEAVRQAATNVQRTEQQQRIQLLEAHIAFQERVDNLRVSNEEQFYTTMNNLLPRQRLRRSGVMSSSMLLLCVSFVTVPCKL